jgi:DNA-binding IscR family transcriptional regulator
MWHSRTGPPDRLSAALHLLVRLAPDATSRASRRIGGDDHGALVELRDAGLVVGGNAGGRPRLRIDAEEMRLGEIFHVLGFGLRAGLDFAPATGCRVQEAVSAELDARLRAGDAGLFETLGRISLADVAARVRGDDGPGDVHRATIPRGA